MKPSMYPRVLSATRADNPDDMARALSAFKPSFVMVLVHPDAGIGWDFWGGIIAQSDGAAMVAVDTTTDAEQVIAHLHDQGVAIDLVAIRGGVGPEVRSRDLDIGFTTDLAAQITRRGLAGRVAGFAIYEDQRKRMRDSGLADAFDHVQLEELLRRLLAQATSTSDAG